MNEIIDTLKSQLEVKILSDTKLASIKRVYKGSAINPSQFPIFAIIPVDETVEGLYNGQLRTRKRIRLESIQHNLDQKKSMQASLTLSENLREQFKVDGDFYIVENDSPLNFSSDVGVISPSSQPLPFREGFLHISAFDVLYYCSQNPFKKIEGNNSSSTYQETNSPEFLEIIENTYRSVLTTGVFIEGVKSLKSFTLGSQITYPVMFITMDTHSTDRSFAGKSLVSREISVNYITKQPDPEKALTSNLVTMEQAKLVMFANSSWGGKAINSEFQSITFGQLVTDTELLYGSSLRFLASTLEKI